MIYCTDQTVTMLMGIIVVMALALLLSYHHLRVREGEWRRRLEREKHRQDLRIQELALAAQEREE